MPPTVEEIDEALRHASRLRHSSDARSRYIDRLLDVRLRVARVPSASPVAGAREVEEPGPVTGQGLRGWDSNPQPTD